MQRQVNYGYEEYSKDELIDLFMKAKTDIEIKKRLVENYYGMVIKVAESFIYTIRSTKGTNAWTDLDDFIQEGFIGVSNAIDNYDPVKSNRANPSTYIYRSVLTALTTYKDTQMTANRTHGMYFPRNLAYHMVKFSKLCRDNPSRDTRELAEEYRKGKAKIGDTFYEALESYNGVFASTNAATKDVFRVNQIEDVASWMLGFSTEDDYSHLDEKYKPLIEAISGLKEREQQVIIARYLDEMTLEEVGEMLGVTRERIRQIQVKAEEKIRKKTKKYYEGKVNEIC